MSSHNAPIVSGAEQAFHPAELVFALFDHIRIGFQLHPVVFVVDLAQQVLVQLQVDHAAFVVHGARRAVRHGLRHVVHVDVVAEHLPRVMVARGDRRARESNERRVRQIVADDLRDALVDRAVLLNLFESVMPAVRLVRDHHDVSPRGQRLPVARFHEILHRREDNPVRLAVFEQPARNKAI